MRRVIVLDSGPLSTIAKPAKNKEVQAITQWAAACVQAGNEIIIPEIVDYEVRRELMRVSRTSSINELDLLKLDFTYLPLTTSAMLKAAELWATVRRQGLTTAPAENIDVDVILAAQALTFGVPSEQIVVATVNPRHLSRFVTADLWQNIPASGGV